MHKFAKKVYISMLSVALICITMFATTYAWVGMLTNSTFDEFDISLSSSKLSEYDVELSLTGEEGTFSSTVDSNQIKRSILKNMGYYSIDSLNNSSVDDLFASIRMDQATVKLKDSSDGIHKYGYDFEEFTDVDGNTGYFRDLDDKVTKKVFQFDLYVSVAKTFDDSNTATDFFLDIYLEGDLFSSKKNQKALINNFTYPSDFVNTAKYGILGGTTIDGNVAVKPENACRIALQKHETVRKYHPEDYLGNDESKSILIFEGGSSMPTIDPVKGYSFGGIMEDRYNLALNDWNTLYPDLAKTVPDWALNRGDVEYNYNDLNQIISKEDKVNTETMVKMSIYFWFEGWDADCFAVVDQNPVDLKFSFTTKEYD